MLESHCPLLAAIPGRQHSVVHAHWDGLRGCRMVWGDCQFDAESLDGPRLAPGRLVWRCHAQLQWWFQETWLAATGN